MSFLSELKMKKGKLKSTQTKVTHADGTQTLETGTESIRIATGLHGFVVDTKPDTIPACILDNFLYVGSQDSVNPDVISTRGITHILSVGIEMPSLNIDSNLSSISNLFVPCLDIPETKLDVVIELSNRFIETAFQVNGVVLVHCNAGVSRAPTIVIAYLVSRRKMTFNDAFELVKAKRECIRPNDGFMKQLKMLSP